MPRATTFLYAETIATALVRLACPSYLTTMRDPTVICEVHQRSVLRGILIGRGSLPAITDGNKRNQQERGQDRRALLIAKRRHPELQYETIVGRPLVSGGSTGFFQSRKDRVPRSATSLSKRARGQDSLSHLAVTSSDSLSKWVAAMWTAWRLWVWGSSMKLRPQLRHEC